MEEEFGQSRFFVLKDPRICRLVPFWGGVLEEFGAAPHYVLTHRNPLEVAASLHKRDGMPIGLGLLIWLRHLLDAEAGTRGQRRCFVNFAGLLTNWAGVVEHIQASLDISLPRFSLGVASEVESFLEGSLRHHREAPEKVLRNPMLSAWVRDSYEVFERWVERGEDSADYPQLDQIRAELDSSAPAFTQIVQSGREEVKRLSGENEALSENLDALRTEKADIVARVDELRGGVARPGRAGEDARGGT